MTLPSAKGLEFPVVYMLAVEQGLLPHERSLAHDEELEEERRLAFVGMTRAMEELYLSHARLREFRGTTQYAIPSDFLEELPRDAIHAVDLSGSAGGTARAIHEWRSGSAASAEGWIDAGVGSAPLPRAAPGHESVGALDVCRYAEGMLVCHDTYGNGRVTAVSGYGGLRKVKVR